MSPSKSGALQLDRKSEGMQHGCTAPVRSCTVPAMATQRPDPRIEDTRKRILAAAFDVIAEYGFDGATIERIAERSGVSRTTIYRRWPDPSQIYLDALHPLGSSSPVRPSGDLRGDLEAQLGRTARHLND